MRVFAPLPVLFAVAFGLAACDSPSPRMMSGDRIETVVEGSAFTIYRKGDDVEVYRTSPEMLPRLSEVHAKAEVAIAQVTGCAVKSGSLVGDAALMRALLDCG